MPIHSIRDALDKFEKSVEEKHCNKPFPPYLEDNVFESVNEHKLSEKINLYDTCFHLIKLYCDEKHSIADTIAPLSHTSNQLDFRLRFFYRVFFAFIFYLKIELFFSWHLAMALKALNYNQVSIECLETIHESYATQLQSLGLWHWAVFVLMHIADDKRHLFTF